MNAQLAQQYQEVLSERTKLQADNDQLKKELDAAKQALDAGKQKLATSTVDGGKLQAQLNAARASEESSKKTVEQTRAKMQELIAQFRDTIDKLRGVETDRAKLQQQLTQMTAALNTSADRNVQMFKINAELLDRMEHRGFFSHVTRAEPFTQIERTRLDNLVLEDQQRIDALHVKKTEESTPADGAVGAPSAGTGPR